MTLRTYYKFLIFVIILISNLLISCATTPPKRTELYTKSYMGIGVQNCPKEIAEFLDLPQTSGALVNGVMPGLSAHKAGLQRGDLIISLNSQPIISFRHLADYLKQFDVGEKIEIQFYRKNELLSTVTYLSSANEFENIRKYFKSEPYIVDVDFLSKLIAKRLITIINEKRKKQYTLAIIDFPYVENKVSKLSRYIGSTISSEIFDLSNGTINIVERQLLEQVLEEQNLWEKGITSKETLNKLRKILGADFVLTGWLFITSNKDIYKARIDSRLISTRTSIVEFSKRYECQLRSAEFIEMSNRIIKSIK